MLRWLTLNRIKQQCRIEPEFTDEDEWLNEAGSSAEDAVLNLLGRSYEDMYEEYGRIPSAVFQASLMLVASLYKDREKDLVQEAHDNKTFAFLLKPYMRLADRNYESNTNQYGCKNL